MNSLSKLLSGQKLNLGEAIELIVRRPEWHDQVIAAASRVRRDSFGNKVFIRGLIEISSYCANDCYYCGLRRSNLSARRYRLSQADILAQADQGYALGVRTFVLQGGEDACFHDDKMIGLITALKTRFPEAAVTLSLGERPAESYQRLKAAGADRYLLRHETADETHYNQLHPHGMRLATRLGSLRQLKQLGYQTGAGMMIGSPGQTCETLAKDLLFLQDLQPEMVGIGPFIHAADTWFSDSPDGDIDLTLYVLGLTRLLLPQALIPATTALATLDETARMTALTTSANVLMPNLTPPDHRADYAIYADKKAANLESIEGLADLKDQLARHGLELDLGRGDFKGSSHV